jgi:surfeit locus 1 family protein
MKRRLFLGLLVLLAAGFVALGIWQVERRTWKLHLIAQVNARLHATPKPVGALEPFAAGDAYTRVKAQGVLLNDRETLVQALTDRGPGWWVMTPLQTPTGVILINRGFVPDERRDPRTRFGANPAGPVTIVGLMRASEPHGGFLRANDPSANRWYSRDTAAIGRARGLSKVAGFFVDADATPNRGGYPIGGLTVIKFRNVHLAYALTWFGLAALCLIGAKIVLDRKGEGTWTNLSSH